MSTEARAPGEDVEGLAKETLRTIATTPPPSKDADVDEWREWGARLSRLAFHKVTDLDAASPTPEREAWRPEYERLKLALTEATLEVNDDIANRSEEAQREAEEAERVLDDFIAATLRDLSRKLEEAEADYYRVNADFDDAIAQRDAAEAALEEARRDSERLDWLEAQKGDPRTGNVTIRCSQKWSRSAQVWLDEEEEAQPHPTLREAIDARRALSPQPEGEEGT